MIPFSHERRTTCPITSLLFLSCHNFLHQRERNCIPSSFHSSDCDSHSPIEKDQFKLFSPYSHRNVNTNDTHNMRAGSVPLLAFQCHVLLASTFCLLSPEQRREEREKNDRLSKQVHMLVVMRTHFIHESSDASHIQ
jgi:hypothetical protein